ncbi:uncharacterized protein LOC120600131 [Pteropus medius]|uniref:uncharacterized protein LOC120600131 n=1 Tax=Pteropus vampyrus TaxID=132908 RepID=UPI00196ACF93|nr:uncharacterized protein LOC120600131 [Pteropus giganteus]
MQKALGAHVPRPPSDVRKEEARPVEKGSPTPCRGKLPGASGLKSESRLLDSPLLGLNMLCLLGLPDGSVPRSRTRFGEHQQPRLPPVVARGRHQRQHRVLEPSTLLCRRPACHLQDARLPSWPSVRTEHVRPPEPLRQWTRRVCPRMSGSLCVDGLLEDGVGAGRGLGVDPDTAPRPGRGTANGFVAADRVAAAAKPSTVGEELTLPAAKDTCRGLLGGCSAQVACERLSASTNGANGRGSEAGPSGTRASPWHALQAESAGVDKATGWFSCHLCSRRWAWGSLKRPSLPTSTTAAALFESVSDHTSGKRNRSLRAGTCTDGVAFCLTAQVKAVASECESTHCVIHRQMLAARKLSPERNVTLQDVIEMIDPTEVCALGGVGRRAHTSSVSQTRGGF